MEGTKTSYQNILQLEIHRTDRDGKPRAPEVQPAGNEIRLHDHERLFVELGEVAQGLVTLHVRQGAVVRQYTMHRHGRRNNKIDLGEASDFLDGELVIVMHAYVKAVDYYRTYYEPVLASQWESGGIRNTLHDQILQMTEPSVNNCDEGQYSFLPFTYTWSVHHDGEQKVVPPLLGREQSALLVQENESLKQKIRRLNLGKKKMVDSVSLEQLEKEVSEIEARIQGLKRRSDKLKTSAEAEKAKTEQYQSDLDAQKKERNRIEGEITETKRQIHEKEGNRDRLSKELETMKGQYANLEKEQQGLAEMEKQVQELNRTKADLSIKVNEAREAVKEMKTELQGMEDAGNELKRRKEDLKQLEEATDHLRQVQAEYQSQKETFIQNLVQDLRKAEETEKAISEIQYSLQRLDSWQNLSEQSMLKKQEIHNKVKALWEAYQDLEWQISRERGEAQ